MLLCSVGKDIDCCWISVCASVVRECASVVRECDQLSRTLMLVLIEPSCLGLFVGLGLPWSIKKAGKIEALQISLDIMGPAASLADKSNKSQ